MPIYPRIKFPASWTSIIVVTAILLAVGWGSSAQAGGDHPSACPGDNVGLNSSINGTISPSGDNDYFRVALSSSGTLTVGTSSGIDTYGYLLDSGCNIIAQDDDSGGSLQFRISRTLNAGNYSVRVRHYYSSGTGSYTLNVSFTSSPPPPPPSDDHGNTCSAATVIGANSSTPGAINPAGDSDFFRLNLGSSGTLTVGTSGSTDTFGDLKDSNCNTIQSNDDTIGLNFQITRSVSAGAYYVAVRHYSSSGTGSYTLNSSFADSPPPPPPDDFGNSCSAALTVGANSSTSGSINFAGDQDFFRLDIAGPGTLTVSTAGSTDTYGYLKDGNCNDITYDDDSGPGTNFEITRAVSAAAYFVMIRHYSAGGTGAYTFNSSFAAQPPQAPATPTGLSATPSPALKGQNITFSWNASAGATYYGVAFYLNGAWDNNWVIASANSIIYPPAGYPSTAGLNSLGAAVIACKNQSQNPCSAPTSQVTVTLRDPVPANMNLTPLVSGSSYSDSLAGSSDIKYNKVANTTTSDQTYTIRITNNTANATVTLVDGNGNPSPSDTLSLNPGHLAFKVSANGERYLKFTGTQAGNYTFVFNRFRLFPYLEAP